MTRRHGRALHRAIRRHRMRRIARAVEAGLPWSDPVFSGLVVATPFALPMQQWTGTNGGTFNVSEWEAALANAVERDAPFMEALTYFRDGLASLPPREPTE